MKKVNGKTLEQWIEQETKETYASLWGGTIRFKPVLCSTILGDGQQLVYLGTIDQRPYYWLILIDSKTDIKSPNFDFEDILRPLEEEFGEGDLEYPAISWAGGHWGLIVNMVTGEIGN